MFSFEDKNWTIVLEGENFFQTKSLVKYKKIMAPEEMLRQLSLWMANICLLPLIYPSSCWSGFVFVIRIPNLYPDPQHCYQAMGQSPLSDYSNNFNGSYNNGADMTGQLGVTY